jgi:hypothetical protein
VPEMPKTGILKRVGNTKSIAMKKFKMGLLALVSFVISIITFSQAPTASGNVMNFSAVASYEPYSEVENTWASLRTIAEQSSTLTTLAEDEANSGSEADTLYPDFLKEVLNTDNIFQIGNYLIKIDLLNDRGLVIAAVNFNAYVDLVNDNLSATGMMVLDGDEDFGLELLEALTNNSTTPAEYQTFLNAERACKGAAKRIDATNAEQWYQTNEQCDIGGTYTIGRTYGMHNLLRYRKSIFYFSLQSRIRSVWRCTFGGIWVGAPIFDFVDLKLIGTVKYRKRCETEIDENVNFEEGYFGGGDGVLRWNPYGGGRSLSHYDFNVDFGIRPAQDRNPNPPPYTPSRHYRIYWGY